MLALISGWGFTDIRNTKHNLTKVMDPVQRSLQDEKEVCVFCHTPSALTSAQGRSKPQVLPRWYSSVGVDHEFVTYDDIGKGGYMDAEETVGSQSLACLSCHDASQAFGVTNLVTLDHPFGVPYRGAKLSDYQREKTLRELASSSEFFRSAKTILSDEFRPVSSGKSGRRQIWWVSSENVGSVRRGKNDLPLYVRQSTTADESSEPVPLIECSSCHDPHSEEPLFLRQTTKNSKLCLTCHDK